MSFDRSGRLEIRRGSWEDRLRELDAEAAAAGRRWALVVEPGAEALAERVIPYLRGPIKVVPPAPPKAEGAAQPAKDGGPQAPPPGRARCPPAGETLPLTAVLPRLTELDADSPLAGVCVCGTGDRADGRKAAWQLEALSDRLWLFVHRTSPPSGLVPTVGEKVRKYLEVIDGLAFREGPR